MKVKIVLFKKLGNGKLFILAKSKDFSYEVFRKVNKYAELYGFVNPLNFKMADKTRVIIVDETTFGELQQNNQFVFPADIIKINGFIPTKDVYVKGGEEFAYLTIPDGTVGRTSIPGNEKVLDLGHAFNFRREWVAELNI